MATGGYIMLDMMGRGLREPTTYDIPGAYKKVEACVKSGKPLMLTNFSPDAYPLNSRAAIPAYAVTVTRQEHESGDTFYIVTLIPNDVEFTVELDDQIGPIHTP